MITIFDPRVVAVPTILDAKLCNYYLDVESSNVIIETILQYVTRVLPGYRSAGAPVTVLVPKNGYTSLGSYSIDSYEAALANYDVRYYTFRDGLADDEFVQINVNTTNSVVGDGYIGSEIQLLNDEDAPGPLKYYGTDEKEEKGFHDLHLPVTIDPASVDLASIGTNQVLTIAPIHPPVTIDAGSTTILSIDENQVLTITPAVVHQPVTIATASAALASIDANQELTINGISQYLYIAYASDGTGTGWSLTPSNSLKYRAEIKSPTELTPIESDFTAATWVKYIGDDGTDGVAASMGYLEYVALISQTGTSAPTAIIHKNDLGTITWSYVGVGIYRATSSGLFTTDKISPIDDIMMDQAGNLYTLNWIDVNTMELRTYGYTDITALANGICNKRYINFCKSLL